MLKAAHLCVRALRHLPQVVLRSGCDATEEDFFRDAAAERHAHPVQQLLLGVEVLLFREVLSVAQTFTTWDDGHLKRRHYSIVQVIGKNYSRDLGRHVARVCIKEPDWLL